MNKYIGAHVSVAGGVYKAVDNALDIGAHAFALFVKNQRQWKAKSLSALQITSFKNKVTESGIYIDKILPHAGYLINLGHPVEENRRKSIESFMLEMERCYQLGLKYLNVHPGSHLREISEDDSLKLVVNSIEEILERTKDVTIVIENTAGQGSNLGYRFEHLKYIIDSVSDKSRIGICIDTCHAFAAGYNIKDHREYNKIMNELENLIDLKKFLCGIHLNDSKKECNSRRDRHESIGKGYLGLDFFERFINDERFDDIPIILETPDSSKWQEEITFLYSMIK